MLITKKSRRPSALFDSRFRESRGVDFPLRQYLRCREDLAGTFVHSFLLGAFAVTLVLFGRTLNRLFDRHGQAAGPWARWAALALLAVFTLSVIRRLYYKVVEIRDIRREMARLKTEFRDSDS